MTDDFDTDDGAHAGRLASSYFNESTAPPVSPESMLRLITRAAEEAAAAGAWPESDGSLAGYDRCSWVCAGAVRETYLAEPRAARLGALELWQVVTAGDRRWVFMPVGLSSPSLFQWGWGVNCARRLCELPPIENPGFMIINGEPTYVAATVTDAIAFIERTGG